MNRKTNFFSFLFILLGSFLVYGNTLSHDFIWDDLILIVDSDALRKWSNLGAFFTTPFFKLAAGMDFPHHRPVVSLLILLTSTFSGLNPFGYHLLNIIFHAAVSWLFYRFLKTLELDERIRVLAAALFLLHPVHVEVVAWPCSATVLAGSIFFLIGMHLSLKLGALTIDKRALGLLGVLSMYGLGLMSYDLALILPAVIFLQDFFLPGKISKKSLKLRAFEMASLSLVALDFLWMRYRLAVQMGGFARFQHGDPNAVNILLRNGPLEPLITIPNVIFRYIEILFFPMTLSPEVYFKGWEYSFSAVAAFIFLLGWGIFIFIRLQKKSEERAVFLFSLSWMAAAFLPLIQIIFQGGLFADRYLYFVSMGFCLFSALLLTETWEWMQKRWAFLNRRFLGAGLAAILCLSYGIKAADQNKIWRDDLTFWKAASILSPDKPRAHHLKGVSLLRFGEPQEAIESFQKAIELSPQYPHPYKGIAIALRTLGKIEEADRADLAADQMYYQQAERAAEAQKK